MSPPFSLSQVLEWQVHRLCLGALLPAGLSSGGAPQVWPAGGRRLRHLPRRRMFKACPKRPEAKSKDINSKWAGKGAKRQSGKAAKGQRGKGAKGQRGKGAKGPQGQRAKGAKGQRGKGAKGQRGKGAKGWGVGSLIVWGLGLEVPVGNGYVGSNCAHPCPEAFMLTTCPKPGYNRTWRPTTRKAGSRCRR